MKEQTLTEIIRLKLKILETITDDLPEELRTPLKQAEKTFIKALHEATSAALAENGKDTPHPTIKPIQID